MTGKLINDCFVHDQDRLLHTEALAILKARIACVVGSERVSIADAHGRILAEPAIAHAPVPAHTNAAVDGYSFAVADAEIAADVGLSVFGRSAAGAAMTGVPLPHTAVRIFTGAVVPSGHDTVAMQEDCEKIPGAVGGVPFVRIPVGLKRGANVRRAGEDVEAGSTILDVGAHLRPQDVAALASIGCADVAVFKRVRVAILSSGDEVVLPGQALGLGQVFDANAPMLQGLVRAAGGHADLIGIAGDSGVAL